MALLLNVLNPLRAFCEGFPWLGAVFLLGLAGYRLGGARLAALVAALTAFCAVTGLWEKTMATVYLCGISAFIACLIGIPIGMLAARSDRFEKIVTPIIDTLQTLPSFCFIIPVVMLFRVGDVTAMIATVAFAVVPAIRYTKHGISQVPPAADRGGEGIGLHAAPDLLRVQLPLALPEIMLGINQTILMALGHDHHLRHGRHARPRPGGVHRARPRPMPAAASSPAWPSPSSASSPTGCSTPGRRRRGQGWDWAGR